MSVVARELKINEEYSVPAYGIDELKEKTAELIPDAQAINLNVMKNMSYKMRRDAAEKFVMAHGPPDETGEQRVPRPHPGVHVGERGEGLCPR